MILGHARAVAECRFTLVPGPGVDARKVNHDPLVRHALLGCRHLRAPKLDLSPFALKTAAAGQQFAIGRKGQALNPLLVGVERDLVLARADVPEGDIAELLAEAAGADERFAV